MAYQDAQVFLLCFNVGDPESLNMAVNKWYPEIRSHCPLTPVILIGCRADARNDLEIVSYLARAHKIPITTEQALLATEHIGAVTYIETTSAYASVQVTEAFELAAVAALGLLKKAAAKKV